MQKKDEETSEVQENGRLRRRAKKAINYAAMGDEPGKQNDDKLPLISPEEVNKELEQWIQLSDDFESHSSHET